MRLVITQGLQYILQIMEYLSICFEEQCRLHNKQILYVRDPDSKLHYNQFHSVEVIHPCTTFIRSFETRHIRFHEKLLKMHSQLREQYEISVERVKQALRIGFQQCERRIKDIYELNGEEITLNLFEPHLREKTAQTELWLTLMNWKKDRPTEDIKEYIQSMPKTLIKEYSTITNDFIDYLVSKLPKSSNNFCEKSSHTKIEDIQADEKGGSQVIQEISKQISGIYERSRKPKEIPLLSEITSARKGADQKEEALTQLAELFCNSKSKLEKKDIGQSLQAKLTSWSCFNNHLSTIFRRVYNCITGQISKDLRYRGSDIKFIDRDLKQYRIWMQSNEADIFIRCIRFFMNLDRGIVINLREIHTIYVSIIIRIMEKTMKKEILLPCNSPAQRLFRDMIYLYNHFGNFHTVTQLVTLQYRSAELLSIKQVMANLWRKIVVETYALIKEKVSVQNVEFFQLVLQEQDFSRQQFWGGIMRQYIKYRMSGRMNRSQRASLEQSMMIVVRNGKALQRFTNKRVDPSFETDAQDEIHSQESRGVSSQENMIEEGNKSLQCPSTAKREQLQSLDINNDEIKQQGSQVQSVLPH